MTEFRWPLAGRFAAVLCTFCLASWIPLRAGVHFSEILYHPPGDRDEEYIELHNSGPESVDLAGWVLSGGVQFVFPTDMPTVVPPGGFLVLCHSLEAFRAAYPDVDTSIVAGEFVGRLANEGERLALVRRDGEPEEALRYDDSGAWDFLADGFGASLERVCFSDASDRAASWRASPLPRSPGASGGTPGAANSVEECPSAPRPQSGVFISEVLYHAVLEEALEEQYEFVEIHNASAQEIDLSDWKLVGEIAGSISYTFPDGAVIAPGGYRVIAKSPLKLASVEGYELEDADLLGPFGGTLDNGGGRIGLVSASGQGVDAVAYDDDFPWPIGADALGGGALWIKPELRPHEAHRHKGHSLERVSFDWPASEVANWAPSPLDEPTPGRANASARARPLTIVSRIDVQGIGSANHLIRDDQPVRVEVSFSPVGFSGAAELEFFVEDIQRDDETVMSAPLRDDGQEGDRVAGDEVFTVVLDAKPENSIVRYRVLADRGEGLEVISPRPTDPFDWYSYFVTPVIDTETKTYHLFISSSNWGRLWTNVQGGRVRGCAASPTWNARVPAIFVHDGEVYDCQARYQGSRWNRTNGPSISRWTGIRPTAPSPPRVLSWRIQLPRWKQLDGRQPIILNKLTQGCPGYNAAVGYRLFEMVGLPASRTEFIRFHINGNYYHYMIELERAGEEMMEHYHRQLAEATGEEPDPVGHLFKSVGCNCDEGPYGWGDWRPLSAQCGHTKEARYAATYDRKTHEWADHLDFVQLVEDLHVARRQGVEALRIYFEENFDVDLLNNYIAVMNWSVPFDDMFQNHFIYQRLTDGKWFLFPWDLDRNFGEWQGASSSIYMGEIGDSSNRSNWAHYLKDAFLKAFRREYEDRLLLLNNTILHPDVISDLVDEVFARVDVDEARNAPAGIDCGANAYLSRAASFKSFATQRFRIVNRQILNADVDAGADVVAFAGDTVQFDARASTPEPGPDVTYTWSNGMEGNFPSFTYEEPGEYEVTLTVTARGVGFTDAVLVEILEIPAQIHRERDGLVAFEAEDFFANLQRDSDRTWWVTDDAVEGFSGAGYMFAHEERRKTFTSRYARLAPELRYGIRFENPGTYRLWVRAFAPATSVDAVHVNLFGAERSSGFRQTFPVDEESYVWSGDTRSEGPQLLTVEKAGLVPLSVWIQESGVIVDKILLALDTEFVPTGLGPDGNPGREPFVRGDVDGNGRLTIEDTLRTLLHLFRGAPIACADHGDFDDDGRLGVADALGVVRYLFLRGPAPQPPFPEPGVDPTPDGIACGEAP